MLQASRHEQEETRSRAHFCIHSCEPPSADAVCPVTSSFTAKAVLHLFCLEFYSSSLPQLVMSSWSTRVWWGICPHPFHSPSIKIYLMYQSPKPALTDCYKNVWLKTQKCILSQFWRREIKVVKSHAFSSLQEESAPCLPPLFGYPLWPVGVPRDQEAEPVPPAVAEGGVPLQHQGNLLASLSFSSDAVSILGFPGWPRSPSSRAPSRCR